MANLNQLSMLSQSKVTEVYLRDDHELVHISDLLDWDKLILIAMNARSAKVKKETGCRPKYRELLGAVVLMALKKFDYRMAEDMIAHYAPARYLCNLNALFKVNQKLDMVTETVDGTPLTLAHARNTPGIGITMPDPCAVTDMNGLDKEAYLFMLAHEYSHGIINQPIDKACDLAFWDQFDESYWDTVDQKYMREVHHVNTDVFALKILSHFHIDQRKGVEGFNTYLRTRQTGINPLWALIFVEDTTWLNSTEPLL